MLAGMRGRPLPPLMTVSGALGRYSFFQDERMYCGSSLGGNDPEGADLECGQSEKHPWTLHLVLSLVGFSV